MLKKSLNPLRPVENNTKPKLISDIQNHLPNDLKQLFLLNDYPLLDEDKALNILGNKKLLNEMLTLMLTQGIDEEKQALEQAYQQHDWKQIEALAHKMKGGATYCGLVKLQAACQYLERYQKSGASALRDDLYQQLLHVINDTQKIIVRWLQNNS